MVVFIITGLHFRSKRWSPTQELDRYAPGVDELGDTIAIDVADFVWLKLFAGLGVGGDDEVEAFGGEAKQGRIVEERSVTCHAAEDVSGLCRSLHCLRGGAGGDREGGVNFTDCLPVACCSSWIVEIGLAVGHFHTDDFAEDLQFQFGHDVRR